MPKNEKNNNVTDLREKKIPEKDKKEPKKSGKKGFVLSWKKIVLILAILVILINAVFAYGIYALGWRNQSTKIFLKIFPYPAALVKMSFVKVSSFYKDLDSYKKYYEVAQKTDFKTDEGQKTFKALKEDLFNQLVLEEIIEKEAKKAKIKVDNKEVDEEYKKLVDKNGEETLKKQIKDYYGWSVSDFKKKIKMMLLGKKLEDKITSDESLNKDKKTKAEEILKRAKAGEDFATLAKQFSEDPSAAEGGNLGWFEKGKMVQEFEDAAFALSVGQISDIVQTEFGYHIIKVNDKKETEVSASHILIKTVSFEDWLKQKEQDYKVKRLLNLDKIKQ